MNTPQTPTLPASQRLERDAQVRAGGAPFPGHHSSGNLDGGVVVSATGVGNNADLTDDVLMVFALPVGAFDQAGRQLNIAAAGNFAANAHNKQFKVWIGNTLQTVGQAIAASGMTAILASGVVANSGGGWMASCQVSKYGAPNSNTQQVSLGQTIAGTTHQGTTAPALLTMTENAVIYVAVTGASGTTGAAGDVLAQLLDCSWSN